MKKKLLKNKQFQNKIQRSNEVTKVLTFAKRKLKIHN